MLTWFCLCRRGKKKTGGEQTGPGGKWGQGRKKTRGTDGNQLKYPGKSGSGAGSVESGTRRDVKKKKGKRSARSDVGNTTQQGGGGGGGGGKKTFPQTTGQCSVLGQRRKMGELQRYIPPQ